MADRTIRQIVTAGLACLVAFGCAPTQPLRHAPSETHHALRSYAGPRLDFAFDLEAPEPTSLDELIGVAIKHHPDLRAAQARVEAARGRMIQAGLYPNFAMGPFASQLGHRDGALGEAGARFEIPIVINNKIHLARDAAALGLEAADWQAITKWFDVVTRVRLSYFEYLAAVYERDTLTSIVGVSAKAYDAAKSLEKAGAGNRPDVLRAKVEFEQNQLKREVSLRRLEAARQNLLTALGRPALKLEAVERNRQELERAPPGYEWPTMLACLHDTSAELQEARALIAQTEKLVSKAQADVTPNLNMTAIPFLASYAHEMRAAVWVTAPVPFFDRNQGNIHFARAEVDRAKAAERQLELYLTERLTLAYQRYQAARQQVATYRETIVPQARMSLDLIEAGYKAGDKKYDYTAVLQAQHVLFHAELAQAQAMGELWRSVAEIAGTLQQGDLMSGCAVR